MLGCKLVDTGPRGVVILSKVARRCLYKAMYAIEMDQSGSARPRLQVDLLYVDINPLGAWLG